MDGPKIREFLLQHTHHHRFLFFFSKCCFVFCKKKKRKTRMLTSPPPYPYQPFRQIFSVNKDSPESIVFVGLYTGKKCIDDLEIIFIF